MLTPKAPKFVFWPPKWVILAHVFAQNTKSLIGNFFLKISFTPFVYVPNDQRVMGIILRYVCWGTHGPPTPLHASALRGTPI